MLIPLIAGLAGAALLLLFLATSYRAMKGLTAAGASRLATLGNAAAACGALSGAVIAFTVAGVLPPLAGLGFATILALAVAALLYAAPRLVPGSMVEDAMAAMWQAVRGAPGAAGRGSRTAAAPRRPPDMPPAGSPVPGLAGPAARAIPPARMDPALDPDPPGPDVASAMVIAPWAALASFVAGFEPENAGEFLAFFRDQARGLMAFAEAMRTCAENCGEAGAGADPAVVQAVAEFGDAVGDGAHDGELVRRRLLVVYGEQLRAVADGLVMPFDARKFLGDAGEAA